MPMPQGMQGAPPGYQFPPQPAGGGAATYAGQPARPVGAWHPLRLEFRHQVLQRGRASRHDGTTQRQPQPAHGRTQCMLDLDRPVLRCLLSAGNFPAIRTAGKPQRTLAQKGGNWSLFRHFGLVSRGSTARPHGLRSACLVREQCL